MGASYSTNEAVSLVKGFWIRLLDGDDCVTYKSTENMLNLATRFKTEFVYGKMHEGKKNFNDKEKLKYTIQKKKEGLRKFIRNCPANSSCILISKRRYYLSGGCHESFVSPDQYLFLRLFASGNGVYFKDIVALLPKSNQIKGRLSTQIKRSRYESILALINFCLENNNIDKGLKKKAYKRAVSRSFNYYKHFNKNFLSLYFLNYIYSKFFFPKNYISIMYKCLNVFYDKENDKPYKWYTGSDRVAISKKIIRK